MRHATLLSVSLLLGLFLVGKASANEPPTVEQLQANPQLLEELYEPAHSLTVEEHYYRGYLPPGKSAAQEIVPGEYDKEDLYVVRNGDQVLYIKKDAFRRTQLSFKAINLQGAAILCLPNPSGGNGWRANPWFVVQADPLKLLGQVSRVVDIDGDETEEPVVVDDIWESYWPLFGHVGAPGASVFYRVLDGALVVDKQATETWASREITELDAQIQEAHSKATSGVPLSTILTKFLYYRVRNHEDIGWDELRKDLRSFDLKQFPARDSSDKDAAAFFSAEDIERMAAESLEKRGSLEQDLKSYTLEPLRQGPATTSAN